MNDCRVGQGGAAACYPPIPPLLPLAVPTRAATYAFPCAGVPPELTLSEAYAILGLHEGSAYDEVLAAKNALLELHGGDFEMNMQVSVFQRLLPIPAQR